MIEESSLDFLEFPDRCVRIWDVVLVRFRVIFLVELLPGENALADFLECEWSPPLAARALGCWGIARGFATESGRPLSTLVGRLEWELDLKRGSFDRILFLKEAYLDV